MAAVAPNLLPDILAVILELIYNDDPGEIPELRLVSRSFNHLSTPLAYRKWVMKTRDLDWLGSENVVENVRCYTRHAVFRSLQLHNSDYIHWDVIFDRFGGLPRLEKLTWNVHPHALYTYCPIPARILQSNVEFYIEDFHMCSGAEESDHTIRLDLWSIPTSNLISLKTVSGWRKYSLGFQKELLVRSPKLQTLHLALDSFKISFSEKCPPLKELVLSGYGRAANLTSISPSWDLRNLLHLELIRLPIHDLFSGVHLENLANVQILRIESPCGTTVADGMEVLGRFFNHIKALSEFKFKGETARLDLTPLGRHMGSLRILVIRDVTVLNKRPFGLLFRFLEHLSESSPKLTELEFELEILGQDWRKFLPVLANFPSLHKLTIHVTPLRPRTFPKDEETAREQFNFDLKLAQDAICYVVRNKVGTSFTDISVFAAWWCNGPRDPRTGRSIGGPSWRVRCFVWDKEVSIGEAGFVKEDLERSSEDLDTMTD